MVSVAQNTHIKLDSLHAHRARLQEDPALFDLSSKHTTLINFSKRTTVIHLGLPVQAKYWQMLWQSFPPATNWRSWMHHSRGGEALLGKWRHQLFRNNAKNLPFLRHMWLAALEALADMYAIQGRGQINSFTIVTRNAHVDKALPLPRELDSNLICALEGITSFHLNLCIVDARVLGTEGAVLRLLMQLPRLKSLVINSPSGIDIMSWFAPSDSEDEHGERTNLLSTLDQGMIDFSETLDAAARAPADEYLYLGELEYLELRNLDCRPVMLAHVLLRHSKTLKMVKLSRVTLDSRGNAWPELMRGVHERMPRCDFLIWGCQSWDGGWTLWSWRSRGVEVTTDEKPAKGLPVLGTAEIEEWRQRQFRRWGMIDFGKEVW